MSQDHINNKNERRKNNLKFVSRQDLTFKVQIFYQRKKYHLSSKERIIIK